MLLKYSDVVRNHKPSAIFQEFSVFLLYNPALQSPYQQYNEDNRRVEDEGFDQKDDEFREIQKRLFHEHNPKELYWFSHKYLLYCLEVTLLNYVKSKARAKLKEMLSK